MFGTTAVLNSDKEPSLSLSIFSPDDHGRKSHGSSNSRKSVDLYRGDLKFSSSKGWNPFAPKIGTFETQLPDGPHLVSGRVKLKTPHRLSDLTELSVTLLARLLVNIDALNNQPDDEIASIYDNFDTSSVVSRKADPITHQTAETKLGEESVVVWHQRNGETLDAGTYQWDFAIPAAKSTLKSLCGTVDARNIAKVVYTVIATLRRPPKAQNGRVNRNLVASAVAKVPNLERPLPLPPPMNAFGSPQIAPAKRPFSRPLMGIERGTSFPGGWFDFDLTGPKEISVDGGKLQLQLKFSLVPDAVGAVLGIKGVTMQLEERYVVYGAALTITPKSNFSTTSRNGEWGDSLPQPVNSNPAATLDFGRRGSALNFTDKTEILAKSIYPLVTSPPDPTNPAGEIFQVLSFNVSYPNGAQDVRISDLFEVTHRIRFRIECWTASDGPMVFPALTRPASVSVPYHTPPSNDNLIQPKPESPQVTSALLPEPNSSSEPSGESWTIASPHPERPPVPEKDASLLAEIADTLRRQIGVEMSTTPPPPPDDKILPPSPPHSESKLQLLSPPELTATSPSISRLSASESTRPSSSYEPNSRISIGVEFVDIGACTQAVFDRAESFCFCSLAFVQYFLRPPNIDAKI
ncbi:hypothetical protein BJ742DRAFT_776944 [Cladochytrium replicatum]|nr:hypothetical protein BJ742DRAFT_776944 [Cladochytrium replicatum]